MECIPYRSFLAFQAMFYVSLFIFPYVIILSKHYGKLSSITTVFSPQKHIKLGIRQSQSVQGSYFLYSGLWIFKFESRIPDLAFWVLDPGSWVLLIIRISRNSLFESIWKLPTRVIQCKKILLFHGFQS